MVEVAQGCGVDRAPGVELRADVLDGVGVGGDAGGPEVGEGLFDGVMAGRAGASAPGVVPGI